MKPALNKLFDKYRDDADPNESPDQIGINGTMKYLEELQVSLDEPAALAILSQIKAPVMGELSREGFTTGWEEVGADTLAKQTAQVSRFREALKTDADLFRTVYKHAFVLAKQPGQKSVLIENAVEFWRMLFSTAGLHWSTKGLEWVDIYLTFMQDKWNKSISKDLWDQTLFFAKKTLSDPTLSWWNETESAWPSILDEFARHVKDLPDYKKLVSGDAMDTS